MGYGTGTDTLDSHPLNLGAQGNAFPARLNADGLLGLCWYDPAARALQGVHGEPNRTFGSPFQVMTLEMPVAGVQEATLDTDGRSDFLLRYANYGPSAFGRIFSRGTGGCSPIELAPGHDRVQPIGPELNGSSRHSSGSRFRRPSRPIPADPAHRSSFEHDHAVPHCQWRGFCRRTGRLPREPLPRRRGRPLHGAY